MARTRSHRRRTFADKLRELQLPSRQTIGAAAIAIAMGAAAMVQSLAAMPAGLNVSPFANPEAGLRSLLVNRASRNPPAQAKLNIAGRSALAASPLSSIALVMLAGTDPRSDSSAQASAAMAMANRLSRREPFVQTWLSQEALLRGRVADGLEHFDQLLRAEPQLGSEIYPQIATILVNREARRAVAQMLSDSPPWTLSFLESAVQSTPDPSSVAQLMMQIPLLKTGTASKALSETLVQRLADANRGPELWQVYSRLPGIAEGSRTGSLGDVAGYVPMAWDIKSTANAGAFLDAGSGEGVELVEAWVNPGHRTVVLSKLLAVPAGGARLSWVTADRKSGSGSEARWRIYCGTASSGKPVAESADLLSPTSASFMNIVPGAACPFQLLTLVMGGGDAVSQVELNLSKLALGPATLPAAASIPEKEAEQ